MPCRVHDFLDFLAPVQALYDLAATETAAASTGKSTARPILPQLYVEGFDAEQIWLQLEMQSEGALKRARRLFRKAGEVPRLVPPEMEEALDGKRRVHHPLYWFDLHLYMQKVTGQAIYPTPFSRLELGSCV